MQIKTEILLFSLFLVVNIQLFAPVQAQVTDSTVSSKKDIVHISGTIIKDNKNLSGAIVSVYCGANKVRSVTTNLFGKYSINLETQKDYIIEYSAKGCVSKKISFSAKVPSSEVGQGRLDQSIDDVELFRTVPGLDISKFELPVTKIKWDKEADWFVRDDNYRNPAAEIEAQQEQLLKKVYDEEITNADKLFTSGNYEDAWLGYEKAASYFPDEKYPTKKLNEIKKKLGEKESINDSYKKAVEKGDELFKTENLELAKVYYNKALSFKPDEIKPKNQILQIDQKLQNQYELTKNNYDNKIVIADSCFKNQNFEEAWFYYKEAQKIIPDEIYPESKINELKTKTTEEKTFAKTKEKADEYFKEKKYDDAEEYYNKAALLKPENEDIKSRLSEIKKIKLTETEINTILIKAKQCEQNKELNKAKEEYSKALALAPDNTEIQAKITEINNLIAAKNDVEKIKAEYQALIMEADKLLNDKKYDQAKAKYTEAEKKKPDEKYPAQKIKEIDNLIAQDKAKQEAEKIKTEYQKLIVEADKLLNEEKYDLAKAKYNEAKKKKPDENYPAQKIKEINNLIAKEKAEEKAKEDAEKIKAAYQKLIVEADKLFNEKKYDLAKAKYTEARKKKSDESYPSQRLKEIDNLLAAQKTKADSAAAQLIADNSQQNITKPTTVQKNDSNILQIQEKEKDTAKLVPQLDIETEKAIENFLKKAQDAERAGEATKASDLYKEVAQMYKKTAQSQNAIEYYNKTITLLKKSGETSEIPALYIQMGQISYDNLEYKQSLDYFGQALQIKEKAGDKDGSSSVMHKMAEVYYDAGEFNNALGLYEKVLDIKEQAGKKGETADIMNDIGLVLETTYQYDKAIEYYQKSLKVKEFLGDDLSASKLCDNIGNVYLEKKEYDDAVHFLELSLNKDEKLGNRKDIAVAMNNLGIAYYNKGDFEKAVEYYENSLMLHEDMGNKMEMAISYNNMGNVNFDWEKYNEAILYYEKSLKLKEELDYKKGIATSLYNIGNVYSVIKNYNNAVNYYNKSLEVAGKAGYDEVINLNNEGLANVYSCLNDYKNAFEHYKQFAEGISSLTAGKRQISEVQVKYERTKKEKQISLLKEELKKQRLLAKFEAANKQILLEKKDTELSEQSEKMKKQKILIYSFIVGFLVILIFSILLYHQSNQRRKANILLAQKNQEILQQKEEIEAQRDEILAQKDNIEEQKAIVQQQKEELEVVNRELTDSILYAKRIQTAVLPDYKLSDDLLGEHFILFLPKDIVSGDFYWATKINELIIFAAVDCTGHGVPGAFMSMLGVASLNEIVRREEISRANIILNELRKHIIESLQQKGIIGEQKDGMDIALCILEKENKQLQFAGANNPLYLITDHTVSYFADEKKNILNLRAEMNNKRLYEIKGDKMPIAIYDKITDFTNCTLQMNSGDQIYIFSDGFPDQQGGLRGKKFKYKPFREMFLESSDLPMKVQKQHFEAKLAEWKGEHEQVDDILIIGVRI
ncbi:MAG: tetratricopeptide repeat protein [Bacteroidia bacterium]|nr:tetratricopeptide repeat protein [Bacteroidia bacterium]